MRKNFYYCWRNATVALLLLDLAPANIIAQDLAFIAYKSKTKLSSQQTNRSLKEVLRDVQNLYKVDLAYQESLVAKKYLVCQLKEEQALEKTLKEILAPFGLVHQRIALTQYAIISKDKTTSTNTSDFGPLLSASNYNGLSAPGFNNLVETKAPDILVTGVVTGETGEGLPGVTVQVKGTTVGATTDIQGAYSLSVPENAGTLVFSYIGYVSQEVPIGNRTTLNVTLRPDAKSLEEVVVIGYGSVKKREVTGAVTSVKPEDLNKGAVTDAMQLIQGKVAGLSVTRTNGGDPTAGLEIN